VQMEARWHGKFIARGFVESAINQVFAKRFVKKQQMRWSDKNRTDCCKRERQCFTKISSDTSWPGTYPPRSQ
jgi:hypothetical protein